MYSQRSLSCKHLGRSAGAWASIKRLVTHRKRSESSKRQKPSEAEVQPEDVALPKKKAKSRLKIPCIRFSRGTKRRHHSKLTEDSEYNSRVQREPDDWEIKTQTQSADQVIQAKSTQGQQEGVLVEDGKEVQESRQPHINAVWKNPVTASKKVYQEATVTQAEEATVVHAAEGKPSQAEEIVVNQAEEATLSQAVEDAVIQAYKDAVAQEEGAAVAQEEKATVTQEKEATVAQADEAALSQAPDLKENGIDTEKPRPEESKRMEPIAIIITDTEISEFDVKKSKNVPKQFLISMENEQAGVFANDSDFEGRTSEQYETLLIETASSLVKNAIQLSVEQLVNEMVSEDNKINTLLHTPARVFGLRRWQRLLLVFLDNEGAKPPAFKSLTAVTKWMHFTKLLLQKRTNWSNTTYS
ncbi:hypothetical protein A6R68_00953 [Neotoma lepida]|uniref:A kinase-anchoring proteins AKAP-5 and AKAP-12 calmodulin (CaM)-binding domain-containing protein n=1 Tax=Neotoma lepida TaxID=56216 RepID=A0A1A6GY12_NEOLE|nr:hypothetical protein A6R68_00953 [Neotoma lepida]